MRDEHISRIEITDTAPLKIAGQLRWTGKAKFPKSLRPRAVVIFQIGDELIGIPSSCPHESASLAEGRFVSTYVIECPLHQNTYDLATGAIKSFKVEFENDHLFLLWRNDQNAPVAPGFGAQEKHDERTTVLEREIEALNQAAELRRLQVMETLQQMEGMIREVEEKRNAFESANKQLASMHSFVARVMGTMSESLLVFDTHGQVKEANKKFLSMVGATKDELAQRPLDSVFDGVSLETLGSATEREFEATVVTHEGERIEHLVRTAPLLGPSGKREGSVVVGTDIRRLKAAQREVAVAYEKVTNLLNSMRQGVFVVLPTGEIADPVSKFSATIFGREIIGANLFDVVFKDFDRRSEAWQLLQLAFLTTFDAEDFQWDIMADHFPRRVLYRRDGAPEPSILRVDYCPLRNEAGLMDRLMLIVDDVTQIELLEQERLHHERQTTLLQELASLEPRALRQFFTAAFQQVNEARRLLKTTDPESFVVFMRTLHTLKGNARMLHLSLIAQATHEAETRAVAWRDARTAGEDAPLAPLREQLGVVQRQVAEYSDVAERILHVPDDHERTICSRLHDAMHRYDVTGEPRALVALADAADATDDEPLKAAIVAHQTGGGPRRAIEDAVLDHLTGSRSFSLLSLSMASWSALGAAVFRLARCRDAQPLDRARHLERALALAGELHLDGVVARLENLDEPQALARIVGFLAFHTLLEGLTTLRRDERERLRSALLADDVTERLEQLVSSGQLRPGTLTSTVERLREERSSASELLDTFGAILGVSRAGLVDQLSTVDAPADLATHLRTLDARLDAEAVKQWRRELSGAAPVSLTSRYLDRSEEIRLARTFAEFVRGRFQLLFEQLQTVEVTAARVRELEELVRGIRAGSSKPDLDRLARNVERLFDVPVLPALSSHYESFKELARRLGKSVDLRLTGDSTLALSREQLERLQEAMVHLIRNSLDHGIETAELRVARGKPDQGIIEINCTERHGQLTIVVRDDGQGIDTQRLKEKAVARGLLTADAAARLDEPQAIDLIFLPHLSTATAVTDISGRGIGMDIVRESLRRVGAELVITSVRGRGAEFRVVFPAALRLAA